jgi:hypothetical protein
MLVLPQAPVLIAGSRDGCRRALGGGALVARLLARSTSCSCRSALVFGYLLED